MKIFKKLTKNKLCFLLCLIIFSTSACGSEDDQKENGNVTDTESATQAFDHEVISVASAADGDYEIYLVDLNLGMATRLTTNESYDSEGIFSPKGKDFIYISDFLKGEIEEKQIFLEDGSSELSRQEITGDRDIFLISPETGRVRLTDNISSDQHISWSPDGKEIVFSGGALNVSGQDISTASETLKNFEILIMNIDSGEIRQLTDYPFEDWYPSWSPDGKEIVFASVRSGNFQLHVTDIEGKNIRKITELAEVNWTPSWSPNGDRIAFSSNSTGNYEIFLIDPDGTNLDQITNNPGSDIMPTWSPDGTRLAFGSDRSGEMAVHTMDSDGKNVENLGWSGIPMDWSVPQLQLTFVRPID